MLVANVAEIAKIGVKRFRKGAKMPTQGTAFASGHDLYAWVMKPTKETVNAEYYPDIANLVEMGVCGLTDLKPEHVVENWEETLAETSLILQPGERTVVKTGLNVRIPAGFEIQVRPRSGLAFKQGLTVLNTPGTIDADYDGDGYNFELGIIVINLGQENITIKHGDRIAQAVVQKVPITIWEEVEGDNEHRLQSYRDGGLGSTGV